MTVTVTGGDRFLKALDELEASVVDADTAGDAAELVERQAKRNSKSRRVRRTARVDASAGRAVIRFGSPSVPWTAPSHFGHGSAARPRAQGGWMRRNPFLFDARDDKEDDVFKLFVVSTNNAIRKAGL